MSLIHAPVSYGELIDKITILEIKSQRITDDAKLANVRNELDLLNATLGPIAITPRRPTSPTNARGCWQ